MGKSQKFPTVIKTPFRVKFDFSVLMAESQQDFKASIFTEPNNYSRATLISKTHQGTPILRCGNTPVRVEKEPPMPLMTTERDNYPRNTGRKKMEVRGSGEGFLRGVLHESCIGSGK